MAYTYFVLRCVYCLLDCLEDGQPNWDKYYNHNCPNKGLFSNRERKMDDNHQTVPTDSSEIKPTTPKVPDMLRECASTYEQRNQLYGDTYKRFGHVMTAIFPDGLQVKTVDDWNRLACFVLKMGKVTRYAANYNLGGHDDSLLDDAVYTTMLRELDKAIDEIPF